jgi:hypothetical protein
MFNNMAAFLIKIICETIWPNGFILFHLINYI